MPRPAASLTHRPFTRRPVLVPFTVDSVKPAPEGAGEPRAAFEPVHTAYWVPPIWQRPAKRLRKQLTMLRESLKSMVTTRPQARWHIVECAAEIEQELARRDEFGHWG